MRKGQTTSPYGRIMKRAFSGPISRPELERCVDCKYHHDSDGYPVIWVTELGHSIKASRVVLAHKLNRDIRVGFCALHHCDRPQCINENHLYEGTLSQNSQDRDKRTGNPVPRGEAHPRSKLTNSDVAVIRQLLTTSQLQVEIAKQFQVSGSTISCIKHNKAWAMPVIGLETLEVVQ